MPLANPMVGDVTFLRPAEGGSTVAGTTANTVVIDGTPIRVVVLALSAAAALTALRWAGFKFNVGVSTR